MLLSDFIRYKILQSCAWYFSEELGLLGLDNQNFLAIRRAKNHVAQTKKNLGSFDLG